MALGGFWNRAAQLLKRQSDLSVASPTFVPSCNVYIRVDGTWIFPVDTFGGPDGGVGVMVGPAETVPPDASADALGKAILSAIDRSRLQIVKPNEWVLPRTAKEAGFRSHADLEAGAAMLCVSRRNNAMNVSAWAASEGGGFVPVPGAERECATDPGALGHCVLELSSRCVRRNAKPGQRSPNPRKIIKRRAAGDDGPISFGYKMSWIAVPETDHARLAKSLGKTDITTCSWPDGVSQAYGHRGVFITPTVNGWTLALGALPECGTETFSTLLRSLSRELGKAFFFGTHRIVGYHAWAHAEDGQLLRAFAFIGERGEFPVSTGTRKSEEIELNTGIADMDQAPDEETVLALASKWVIDPRRINESDVTPGPGHFAK